VQTPDLGEQQTALILLKGMKLTPDARAVLVRISRGQPVQKEALSLLPSLAKTYIAPCAEERRRRSA
jgi:hypothetical protein